MWAASFWQPVLQPAWPLMLLMALPSCMTVLYPNNMLIAVFGTWKLSLKPSQQPSSLKTFSDHTGWTLLFIQVVLGFRGPHKMICREEFGGCGISLFLLLCWPLLSSWIWHSIYLTVHFVLLRQGKSHKTTLAHQHFHCVLGWASLHMVTSPF